MNAKDRIIAAAVDVFSEKGKYGARMEEIAAKARMNKAMLYYYFSTKENLYREVLALVLAGFFEHITAKMEGLDSFAAQPAKGIALFAETHLSAFTMNPKHTRIYLEAVINEPQDITKVLKEKMSGCRHPSKMEALFKEAIKNKQFRKVDPRQVIMSIVGMNLIYLAARPIAQTMLGLATDDEQAFLRERGKSIVDLVLNGIIERKTSR